MIPTHQPSRWLSIAIAIAIGVTAAAGCIVALSNTLHWEHCWSMDRAVRHTGATMPPECADWTP